MNIKPVALVLAIGGVAAAVVIPATSSAAGSTVCPPGQTYANGYCETGSTGSSPGSVGVTVKTPGYELLNVEIHTGLVKSGGHPVIGFKFVVKAVNDAAPIVSFKVSVPGGQRLILNKKKKLAIVQLSGASYTYSATKTSFSAKFKGGTSSFSLRLPDHAPRPGSVEEVSHPATETLKVQVTNSEGKKTTLSFSESAADTK